MLCAARTMFTSLVRSCSSATILPLKQRLFGTVTVNRATVLSPPEALIRHRPLSLPSAGLWRCQPLRTLIIGFENTEHGPQNYIDELAIKGPYQKKRSPRRHMEGKPFMKGVVLKTLIKKPKKPNSANRKCVRVKLSNGREVTAYVPGEGHNLQEHNTVLVRGGRVQDLIGVKHKVVRGKFDCAPVQRKQL